jgi:hypothetical protein
VQEALAKDPQDRPAAHEILDRLTASLAGLGPRLRHGQLS